LLRLTIVPWVDRGHHSRRTGRLSHVEFALLVLLCIGACTPARGYSIPSAGSPIATQELRLGLPIDEPVDEDSPRVYWFESERGNIFTLLFEQTDLMLRVTVTRPDGFLLLERLTPRFGVTPIVARATLSGKYLIAVYPEKSDGHARRFHISLADIGQTNLRRSAELTASAALALGDKLAAQWTESSLIEAARQFGSAGSEWHRAGDLENASCAFIRQANIYDLLGQFEASFTSYRQGLQLMPSQSRLSLKIDILNSLAELELEYTKFDEAKMYAESAKSLSVVASYDKGRGRALAALGLIAFYRNNTEITNSSFEEAQSIWAINANRESEALTLLYMSSISAWKSDYAAALEDLTQALKISRNLNARFVQAEILANLGNVNLHLGELEHARDDYAASLALVSQIGSRHLKAEVLDDFGFYLENVGNQDAYRLYIQAVALAKNTGDRLLYAVTLSDVSRASITAGKPNEALHYCARERRIARILGDPALVALSLRDTGEAYMSLGTANQAFGFFTEALDPKLFGTESAEWANTKIAAALALEGLGRFSEASAAYREAAKLCAALGSTRAEADARYHIARLETAQRKLEPALVEIEKSVSLIESLRTRVSADDTRITWFATFQSIYKLYIDVLMQLSAEKNDTEMTRRAFRAAEQSIARTFVELMHESQVGGGDTQELMAERSSLRRRLTEKTLEESKLIGASRDPVAMRRVASEISDLQDRAEEIQSLIHENGPEGNQLQVEPVGAEEVQSLIGDEDLVLEYSLGSSRSFVWAISRERFASYTLPPRLKIESMVRTFRDALVNPTPTFRETNRKLDQQKGQASEEEHLASTLGHMLLGPVADRSHFKRIVIVADGGLQYLPFGVLIVGSNDRNSASEIKRLADDYEVINLPSMTALAVLRRRMHWNGFQSKGLLVFADPVFERDDPRINPAIDGTMSGPPAVDRNQATSSTRSGSGADTELPRLPGTRREAEVIAEAAPKGGAEVLLGFDANRLRAISQGIGSYSIIHFATHSRLNDEYPESSGVILSLFDRHGNPEDGYVRLKDIYDLKLSADLVVLSACDTALGKDINGEGIVGLTRGFMYAGVSRVVATLWRVDDEATSELMKWFYIGILQRRESPATSLREAQKQVRKQARWRSPYYWGAFIIEGDWREPEEGNGIN
jgi:CHAT domain-containing protein